ncbi:MAG: nucleotide exchange factor GrpE [Anaerolineae bacterium]|nr:nucleotide exchange factor GrpE [Anaerolineae bacterium]
MAKENKNEVAAEQLVNPQAESASQPETAQTAPEAVSTDSADLQGLKNELEKVRKQADENLVSWQRERADFTNYKKRIEREQEMLNQNITAATVKKFLVILDDLERAMKLRPTSGEGAAWAEGMELVYRKFISVVESCGVTAMQADNAAFDPNLHEAITHEDSPDHQSGQIIEVVQKGYMIGDRVMRPALVRVAR